MTSLLHDFRHAIRNLVRSPGFTLLSVTPPAALAASLQPALRAARGDPLEVLRSE